MLKFILMKLFYIAVFLGIYCKCYAETTSVYCANSKGVWNWLVDDKNSYVNVTGYWRTIWLSDHIFMVYFELSDGKNEFNRLKDLCVKNIGKDYNIVQPANSFGSDWLPFLVDNNYITNGNFFIYKYINKLAYPFGYKIKKIFLKNIYPLNNTNNNFLTFSDLNSMCLRLQSRCW